MTRLKKIAEKQTEAGRKPELSYYLAEKLRIMHQRTHPGRVTKEGRGIEPEFAFTVVQDLIEILRELGYTRK